MGPPLRAGRGWGTPGPLQQTPPQPPPNAARRERGCGPHRIGWLQAEALNKILQAEWAYRRPYGSNQERLDTLPAFLTYDN